MIDRQTLGVLVFLGLVSFTGIMICLYIDYREAELSRYWIDTRAYMEQYLRPFHETVYGRATVAAWFIFVVSGVLWAVLRTDKATRVEASASASVP